MPRYSWRNYVLNGNELSTHVRSPLFYFLFNPKAKALAWAHNSNAYFNCISLGTGSAYKKAGHCSQRAK